MTKLSVCSKPNCQIIYAVTYYNFNVGELLFSHGYCPKCGLEELEKLNRIGTDCRTVCQECKEGLKFDEEAGEYVPHVCAGDADYTATALKSFWAD